MKRRTYGLWGVAFAFGFVPGGLQAPAHAYEYIPPSADALKAATVSALPETNLPDLMALPRQEHRYTEFRGANAALRAQSGNDSDGGYRVGENRDIMISGDDLFGAPTFRDGRYWFVATVSSTDAECIRIRADFSDIQDGVTVWTLEPGEYRAFEVWPGADSGAFAAPEGDWLPMTQGDTAWVVAASDSPAKPQISVTAYSHIFDNPLDVGATLKVLSCNIEIPCETEAKWLEASSAIGLIVVTTSNATLMGTGCLINNPDTPDKEPYFLTANHVINTSSYARQAEIYWDYRADSCEDPASPPSSNLPRSKGTALLRTDSVLDLTIMKLDEVPVGSYGRAYLDYSLRDPVVGEVVVCIHHPDGGRMRISYGAVKAIDTTAPEIPNFDHETKVGWDRGVTEHGSSGSPLFFQDGTYQVCGALSGGSNHRCGAGPDANYDFYSSFRRFYDKKGKDYLSGTEPPIDEEDKGCFTSSAVMDSENPPSAPARFLPYMSLILVFLGWRAAYWRANSRVPSH